jgi:hypothetical protein
VAHGEIDTQNLDFMSNDLIELSLLDDKYSQVKNIQVALMSDCENIKKLNYYIFSDVKDVDYYTIDSIDEKDISMLDSMDIIVFNKEDEQLKQMLLHNIKAKNLQTKFFLITNKNYLRQKDILKEHIDGVDKLLKMEFFLEDYILSVEKYLHSNFYSKRIFNLEDENEIVLKDKTVFDKKIEDFISKKIFFSLFNYTYSSEIDINSYNIRKIVRESDYILVNEESKEITFLLINVIPEYGCELIKTRINNFSITLQENHKLSAFDLIYES